MPNMRSRKGPVQPKSAQLAAVTHGAIRFLCGLAFLALGPWELFQFSGLGPVLMYHPIAN